MTAPKRDEILEATCDKIRNGEPVGIFEALEAIEYQQRKRHEREANSLVARLKRPARNA